LKIRIRGIDASADAERSRIIVDDDEGPDRLVAVVMDFLEVDEGRPRPHGLPKAAVVAVLRILAAVRVGKDSVPHIVETIGPVDGRCDRYRHRKARRVPDAGLSLKRNTTVVDSDAGIY
jgi:hypothetical protein